ncbi:MAG: Crp/Fnr family transcriptional regulator [Granulosicoccus sp.]
MITDTNTSVSLLSHVELFSHLTNEQLEQLAAQARELTFRKHAVMMNEGDPGESMFVIKSGAVKVFLSDEDGRELVLYEQGTGAVIGDIALLDNEPRSASVMTLEPVVALMIGKQAFLDCLRQSPETAINIIRSLTTRLRDATEGSRRLALDNVYRRLVDKLHELAGVDPQVGVDSSAAELPNLPKKYSHQELGNMIGASREMVGKIMAELVKGDYVEVRDGRLHLLKKLPRNW